MENGANVLSKNDMADKITLTANEVANTIGENYKSVAKMLKVLATNGDIEVTEKFVNNRALTGYKMSISDIQTIKGRFIEQKHLQGKTKEVFSQMLKNADIPMGNNQMETTIQNDANVKLYEEINKNTELIKELSELKLSIQKVESENVQLNADLTVARSELKYIEDKNKTVEAENSRQRLEVERLNKVVKNRNIALLVLGAVLLVIVAVIITLSIVIK